MKHEASFCSKDKSKKIKVSSAAIFLWHFKSLKKGDVLMRSLSSTS